MDKEVSRAELIKELSERMMLRERQCVRVFNFMMSEIVKTIEQGDRFEIRGFGILTPRFRRGRMGRNPKSGMQVEVPPRYTIQFKPGKTLRETVDFQRMVDEANRED